MPTVKAIHFNPQNNKGKTRCGRHLSKVTWRTDAADATCNFCVRLIAKDAKVHG